MIGTKALILTLLLGNFANAFVPTIPIKSQQRTTTTTASTVGVPIVDVIRQSKLLMVKNMAAHHHGESKEYWLDEFKAPTGEILNPYKVLKVKRDATIPQIKNAYREQSRRYHPDTQRYKSVLPGRCNNLEDVRDEWERIKLSYEILRDPRTRKRYDRHEVLADPGAAVGRAVADAALGAVGKGLAGVGSGIFAMGSFAFEKLSGETTSKTKQPEYE